MKSIKLLKLKKISQDNLYNSLENEYNLNFPQTYIPLFSKFTKFDTDYSKKMFIFNNPIILLKILDEENIIKKKKISWMFSSKFN